MFEPEPRRLVDTILGATPIKFLDCIPPFLSFDTFLIECTPPYGDIVDVRGHRSLRATG